MRCLNGLKRSEGFSESLSHRPVSLSLSPPKSGHTMLLCKSTADEAWNSNPIKNLDNALKPVLMTIMKHVQRRALQTISTFFFFNFHDTQKMF